MNSRRILGAAILFCAATPCHAKPAKPRCAPPLAPGAIAVAIDTKPGAYTIVTPIPATVTLANQSAAPVLIPALMEPEDYWLRFDIKDKDGKLIAYSGPEINAMDQHRTTFLLPGYSFGKKFANVAALYPIAIPGRYTLQAVYGKSPTRDCDLGEHRSNIVELVLE
ncbi:MAG TPA: hypothetical protein VGC21_00350 [Telluria sp.]|jgi:hypothetical protein